MQHIWQHEGYGRTPHWLIIIGAFCAIAYAFSKLHFDDISGIAEPIVILAGFWCIYRYGGDLRRSRIFWFLWLGLLVEFTSWGWSQFSHPELAEDYPHLGQLARPLIFILIAWWLGGSTRNTLFFWSAALFGVLLSPWLSGGGFAELAAGLRGARIDFDLRNAQHTSLFFGTALIALVALHRRFLLAPKFTWSLRLIWVAALAFSFTVIILTQTRAAWVSLLPAAGYIIFQYSRHALRTKVWLPALIGLAAIIAALYPAMDGIVEKRLSHETEVLEMIFRGELEQVPYSSIGIRVHAWRAGLEFFAESPLLGWGRNGRSIVFDQTEWLQVDALEDFGHLHSTYIDMMVNYGLIGLCLYISLLAWLTRRAYAAYKSEQMPYDIFTFFIAFLIFWSIMNVFESYLFFWTGVYVINVVCAGILTHIWKPAIPKMESAA